ncbi:cation transporter [Dictyobacter kobayashii]|uniref:Cation efflux protein transmembrane domain-containing protein n=1 Tax=Dictyobacter kobayashii TaxID=2014872 RepID=A0A402AQP6_9CHLR|nr:cation transporter [Dictyobacter kobayashii]GCE21405.1 hypothetical protein KDK_52050 [Dictyobacter kobayashii]
MARPFSIQRRLEPSSGRAGQLRQGIIIEAVALLWMVIEAGVALSSGISSRSVSLEGFGIDSIIELIAGGILLWRLWVEVGGGSGEVVAQAERRASWVTAISLFALAAYILIDSAISLFTHSRPTVSWWGLGIASAAALIMPLLWQSKLRIARRIGSAALKADAACSVTCAYMSLTLLLGLLLNAIFGWWWADPLAALLLIYFIVREGREAWHAARTGEACGCGCDDD